MSQKNLFDDADTDWIAYREAMKIESQERRASNLTHSLRLLFDTGIKFTTANGGVHSVIEENNRVWDFWPTTGKWSKRENRRTYQRGVYSLIKDILEARGK